MDTPFSTALTTWTSMLAHPMMNVYMLVKCSEYSTECHNFKPLNPIHLLPCFGPKPWFFKPKKPQDLLATTVSYRPPMQVAGHLCSLSANISGLPTTCVFWQIFWLAVPAVCTDAYTCLHVYVLIFLREFDVFLYIGHLPFHFEG